MFMGLFSMFAGPPLVALIPEDLRPDGLRAFSWVAAQVAYIFAAGWLIGALVDEALRRRLRRLELDVEDNLRARKIATQLDVIRRIWVFAAALFTCAAALTVIPGVRQIGVSLFASAGIAGIAIGIAARPVLSNLISGLQIAFTQPIRIDDVVIVEGEWGWVEQITLFYVVVKVWDLRRLVVPLSYFTEKPFQNWTRETARIIGPVTWSLDHRAPVPAIREKVEAIVKDTPLWDGQVVNVQVTDASGPTITVRALASAATSPKAWDLRCLIREQIITWLQEEYPDALPQQRLHLSKESAETKSAHADP
jgi:small-conductance mechanosensitive channel